MTPLMLKTAVLLIKLFEIESFCDIIDIFPVTFNQFNASLMNKSFYFSKKKKKKLNDPKLLNFYVSQFL